MNTKYKNMDKEPVIFVDRDGFDNFLIGEGLSNSSKQIIERLKKTGVLYGIPRCIGSLDYIFGMTYGYKRTIIAGHGFKCREAGRYEQLDGALRDNLVEGTRLIYLSHNGDAKEFLAKLPEEKRKQVVVIEKEVADLSEEEFRQLISRN